MSIWTYLALSVAGAVIATLPRHRVRRDGHLERTQPSIPRALLGAVVAWVGAYGVMLELWA